MEAKTIQKYKDKSHPWLKRRAIKLTNELVRLRDSYPDHVIYKDRYFKCIACGGIKGVKQMDAGHLYSAGEYNGLRFDLDNINGECRHCNSYSGDHLIKYRKNLILKIGNEAVENLEFLADAKSKSEEWDRFDLIDIIENRKQDIKSML